MAQEAASPPTLREALALLAAAIRRDLTGGEPLDALEVTFGFAGRTGSIPVSFAKANVAQAPDADEGDVADRILAVLKDLTPGSWMSGKNLAPAAGLEPGTGYFQKMMTKLVDAGKVSSSKHYGYQINDPDT